MSDQANDDARAASMTEANTTTDMKEEVAAQDSNTDNHQSPTTENDAANGDEVAEWVKAYPEKLQDMMSRFGQDERHDPRAKEFNRRLLEILETTHHKRVWEYRWFMLNREYWTTAALDECFVAPFRENRNLQIGPFKKTPRWMKKYPRQTWFFLEFFGVNDAAFEGADRYNVCLIEAVKSCHSWENFKAGFEMLEEYYWRTYCPKDTRKENPEWEPRDPDEDDLDFF